MNFYGKFRGIVIDNLDPLGRGRIKAQVSEISGTPTNWAEACVPYSELITGFIAVPPIGNQVWIEFEHGNPDYPIWTGCPWGSETRMNLPE
jgi:uncharacterized protein involved in type VI secretion and phage assembly